MKGSAVERCDRAGLIPGHLVRDLASMKGSAVERCDQRRVADLTPPWSQSASMKGSAVERCDLTMDEAAREDLAVMPR